jgi:predicted RNA-binding Zn-ribbon protein involved in translation (DUF1610 family)
MSISFQCTQCGRKLKAPDNAAGRTSKCPGCGAVVVCPQLPQDDAGVVEMIIDEPAAVDPYSDVDDGTPYGVAEPLPAAPPPGQDGRRPCPMCGEMILATANKCRYCGEVFGPAPIKAPGKKKKKKYSAADEKLTVGEIVLSVLCSGIACIVGIIWMIQGKPKGLKMFGISMAAQVGWYVVGQIIRIAVQGVPTAPGVGGP